MGVIPGSDDDEHVFCSGGRRQLRRTETGGANKWHLEKEYLEFPDDVPVPENAVEEQPDPEHSDDWVVVEDNKSQISNVYNQIWEAKGADDLCKRGQIVTFLYRAMN